MQIAHQEAQDYSRLAETPPTQLLTKSKYWQSGGKEAEGSSCGQSTYAKAYRNEKWIHERNLRGVPCGQIWAEWRRNSRLVGGAGMWWDLCLAEELEIYLLSNALGIFKNCDKIY